VFKYHYFVSSATGGLLGVAGRFPPMYMGGVFAGQALGGIFASVTNVVMFALGADPVWGAFFCFLVAVLFLFSALVAYLAVAKTEFYQVFGLLCLMASGFVNEFFQPIMSHGQQCSH
jgi:hypothetical protein